MKKALIYITSVALLLTVSFFSIFIDKNKYDKDWENLGNNSSSKTFYIRNNELDIDQLYNTLAFLSEKYKVNLYRSDNEEIDNKDITVKSVYISFPDGIYDRLSLQNGRIPTNEELIAGKVLTTSNFKDNNNTSSIGELFSFFGIQYKKVQSLSRYVENTKNICGTYNAVFQNRNNSNDFFNELATELGTNSEELQTKRIYHTKDDSGIALILILSAATIFGLFFILSAYYIVRKLKEVGICKLMGYDNKAVWCKYFIPILVTQAFTSTIIILICRLFYDAPKNTIINLTLLLWFVIFITFLICLVFYSLLKKYTVSSLLKNKNPSKIIIKMNFVLRTGILIIMCSILLSAFYGFTEINNKYKIYKYWDNYKKTYAVMKIKLNTEDHSDIINETHIMDKKYANLYTELNKLGAEYAKYDEIQPFYSFYNYDFYEKESTDHEFKEHFMTVNLNYLDTLALIDEDHKKIIIGEDVSSNVYIVPISKKNDLYTQQLLKAHSYYVQDSSNRYFNENSIIDNNEIKIYYYTNVENFFSFERNINDTDLNPDYTISSPIFRVLTNNNITTLDAKNIAGQGESSPLKINIKGKDPSSVFKDIKPIIQKCGLENNISGLEAIGAIFDTKIASIKKAMKIYFFISLILFIVSCFISMQTIEMIIELNKQSISVKKLLGYKFRDKYAAIVLLFIVEWPIIMFFSEKIYRSIDKSYEYSLPQIIVVILMGGIDILFILLYLFRFEKTKLSKLLKE